MPDDVSPAADPRSVDDMLTQMFMRQQAQQQMPFFQGNLSGDLNPSRLPRGYSQAEIYSNMRQHLDPTAARRALKTHTLNMNTRHPDIAQQFNYPNVITPEQYDQYQAQVPGS